MVEFSYKWFCEECEKARLNPGNELSESAIFLAHDRAVEMKMYMDAKEDYDDEVLKMNLQANIDRLNNARIGHMLDALFYAEVMSGLGDNFNKFVKRKNDRKRMIIHDKSMGRNR